MMNKIKPQATKPMVEMGLEITCSPLSDLAVRPVQKDKGRRNQQSTDREIGI
jgi:hypothetical protein